MDIEKLLNLATAGGAPMVVACVALWIIHKRDAQTMEILTKFQQTTDKVLECQDANTEALTRLDGHIENNNRVMDEVHTLLVRINGKESK
jgi:hypothetical protein